MRRFFLLFLLVSSLFLAPSIFGYSQVQGQNVDHYSLGLQGFVWHQTTLNTLIVTPINVSWWNVVYLNSTLRAIGQWNDAIANFALNYSDFAYLSVVRIQSTVSNVLQSGYDIYINWTDVSLSSSSDEVGLSRILPDSGNAIINCTINLAVRNNHGDSINEVDSQNIALHELGHSLGLGHGNYSGDLMYPAYSLGGSPQGVSTLDAYGVATLFAWELNASSFYPVRGWLNENSVVLPSNVPYKYLPVSPQNAAPQTLANNPVTEQLILMWELLLHPIILIPVIVVLAFFVILGLIVRKRTHAKAHSGTL